MITSDGATTHHQSSAFRLFRRGLAVLLGLAFLAAGSAKLAGAAQMIAIFDQIGAGQWLRYVTGTIEVAGAVLVLWPARSAYGSALLACTMAGALFTHFAVIGGTWQPAAGLFVMALASTWMHRSQLSLLRNRP